MAEHSTDRILVFDTNLTGHHSDYLRCLIGYWCSCTLPGELLVVTPAGLEGTLAPDLVPAAHGVRFVEIPEAELEQAHRASRLTRALAEWNLYLRYARQLQPTHALLMYLDLYQPGLWLGGTSPCPVSGIFFRPNFHYETTPSWLEKAVVWRKKWLLRKVLTNPMLSTLFCLDASAVPAVQALSPRAKVRPLSDPVHNYPLEAREVEAKRKELGIEPGRTVLLLFGYLDDRKGIEPVLEAIGRLSPQESTQLCLLLAGPLTTDYRQQVERLVAALPGQAQVIRYFQEIKGRDIQVFFALSDYVLTLYQRHIGMSSVVVRAAVAGKPLLSSDFGYMGALVRQEQLGTVVDSESVEAITEALRRALTGQVPYDPTALQRLANENTPEAFARQLLREVTLPNPALLS
jgi:glycosyltransferase involved in cell wall biosynthesis